MNIDLTEEQIGMVFDSVTLYISEGYPRRDKKEQEYNHLQNMLLGDLIRIRANTKPPYSNLPPVKYSYYEICDKLDDLERQIKKIYQSIDNRVTEIRTLRQEMNE
jgi:hypothetical protein